MMILVAARGLDAGHKARLRREPAGHTIVFGDGFVANLGRFVRGDPLQNLVETTPVLHESTEV